MHVSWVRLDPPYLSKTNVTAWLLQSVDEGPEHYFTRDFITKSDWYIVALLHTIHSMVGLCTVQYNFTFRIRNTFVRTQHIYVKAFRSTADIDITRTNWHYGSLVWIKWIKNISILQILDFRLSEMQLWVERKSDAIKFKSICLLSFIHLLCLL